MIIFIINMVIREKGRGNMVHISITILIMFHALGGDLWSEWKRKKHPGDGFDEDDTQN